MEQRKTAAYWNPNGDLVIRQKNWPDEDSFVIISADRVGDFIDKLTDVIGISVIPMRAKKSNSAEVVRARWVRQVMADPKIQLSHLKVVNVIGEHVNRDSGQAFPGIKRIAAIAHLNPRTVIRAIKWLDARGHLRVDRVRKCSRNLANRRHANVTRSR